MTTDILRDLKRRLPRDAVALIALTELDLWPGRGWNFVFGQASFRDRVGVYSVARYHPSFYGETAKTLKKGQRLVLGRSLKVMAHEIGHMLGIHHCIYYECVLNGTNHMAETDRRPLHLCPLDLRKLQRATRFHPVRRYRELLRFYRANGLDKEAAWIRTRLVNLKPSR